MNISELEKAFRSHLSMDAKDLDELSSYLTKRWKMFCFAETTESFGQFVRKNEKAILLFEAILQENESKKDSPSSYSPKKQKALYDKLARPPFGTWTMSVRWPQVLSSLAAVDRLFSVRRPSRVLEIGCGTGFACDWLRTRYDFHYTGIDFSTVAIAEAKRQIKVDANTVFQESDVNTFESNDTFDLIFSIAGLPRSLDAVLVDKVARNLGKQGIFYIQVAGPPGPASKWNEEPKTAKLVFEDSTGGLEFAGGGYNHTSNFVFATSELDIAPLIYRADESWGDFANCMNSGQIHERERNFGYFNANGRPNTAWPFQHGKWDKI